MSITRDQNLLAPAHSGERILFVDDDEQLRLLFRSVVESIGYRVDVASDGEEALRLVAQGDYSVVVTDYRMPRLDGLSLIAELQTYCPETSCILVSGDPSIDLPEGSVLRETLMSVIPKPWDRTELLTTISRAVQLSKDRQEQTRAPLRILLVEDSPDDTELLRQQLERVLACELHIVSRLDEACVSMHEEEFDIVITDLSLPDASGIETVRRLQQARGDVPIVVLSGQSDRQVAMESLRFGAQEFLLKGRFDDETLYRALHHSIERRRSQNELEYLASHDPLTGLGNRAFFRSRLTHALARSRREGHILAVLFVDLDRFKEINDGWGHHAGDAVLREVARRIRGVIREPDSLARLGGDEFGILLEDLAHGDESEKVAQRVAEALVEPILVGGIEMKASASIGIALPEKKADSAACLLRRADQAMYNAKNTGGHAIRRSIRAGHGKPARFIVEREFDEALSNGDFFLEYQPQLDLSLNRFVAVEALLRWRRSGRIVSPDEFIPLLEETGQIREVGAWVIKEVCKKLQAWRGADINLPKATVNLSPLQFRDGSLLGLLEESLLAYDIPAQALEMEITETVLMDRENCIDQLRGLRDMGVTVAIDDFGTGYSSLSYLYRFPVDVLKIDRSFIGEIDTNKDATTLVASIIRMGHALGLEVVGEGVETRRQLQFLQSENCNRSQGYLHSKPLSSAGVPLFLQKPVPRFCDPIIDVLCLQQERG